MLVNIIGFVVILLLAAAFALLFFRAGRFKRGIFRLGGRVVGGLGAIGFLVLAAMVGRGLYVLYAPHPVTAMDVTIASTSEQLARGEHLASSLCAACHTTTGDLPLSGGINLSDDAKMPLGDIFAPNITPGGNVKNLTDGDIWRLFREGILPDGRAALMPVAALKHLGDEDLKAVIAFVRSQPAVEKEMPAINPSLLMAVAVGSGMFPMPIPPEKNAVVPPPVGPTAEYGKYIVDFSDCRGCHGPNLDGKVTPPFPAGPNLVVVKGWTAEQFINTMRTGVNPGGMQLKPPMPWKPFGKMSDTELTAVWTYLKSLP
jgi:mono/diheme cytochrome c family protein